MERRNPAGWVAVGSGTALAALWAFWGSMENFHEGWWRPTLAGRVGESFLYLAPMLISIALTVIGIRFPRVGAVLFTAAGILFGRFVFSRRALSLAAVLSWLPVTALPVVIGLLFWFGRPRPRARAYRIAAGLPLLVAVLCAAEPAWRVAHRFYDGDRGMRLVEGNGVRLIWAPAGPGWSHDPRDGPDWQTARDRCAFLSEDGLHLAGEPQNIWRLPTVDEIVRSMTRGGTNAGGSWNEAAGEADYKVRPDKESPLWDIYSPKIYYWTATEADGARAYRITYDGRVWSVPKSLRMGSQGFRAVKEPKP